MLHSSDSPGVFKVKSAKIKKKKASRLIEKCVAVLGNNLHKIYFHQSEKGTNNLDLSTDEPTSAADNLG